MIYNIMESSYDANLVIKMYDIYLHIGLKANFLPLLSNYHNCTVNDMISWQQVMQHQ